MKADLDGNKLLREIGGGLALFTGLFLLLCLFTFNPDDPHLNRTVSLGYQVRNKGGMVGAYLAALVRDFLGLGAFAAPFLVIAIGLGTLVPRTRIVWWRWLGIGIFLAAHLGLAASDLFDWLTIRGIGGGGLIGNILHGAATGLLFSWGAGLLWFALTLLALRLVTGISWSFLSKSGIGAVIDAKLKFLARYTRHFRLKSAKKSAPADDSAPSADHVVATAARAVRMATPPPLPPDDPEAPSPYGLDPVADFAPPPEPDLEALHARAEALRQERQPVSHETRHIDSLEDLPCLTGGKTLAQHAERIKAIRERRVEQNVIHEHDVRAPRRRLKAQTPNTPEASEVTGAPEITDAVGSVQAEAPEPDATPSAEPVQARLSEIAPSVAQPTPQPLPKDSLELKGLGRVSDLLAQLEAEEHRPAPGPQSAPTPPTQPLSAPRPVAPTSRPATPLEAATASTPLPGGSDLPPTGLLAAPGPNKGAAVAKEELEIVARRLESCLADFSVQGVVRDILPGPVVTMYEYKPAPGVKISRISGLSDDLALGLKAEAVRIVAPLPGKDSVGVEIPNRVRRTVYLREILESPEFRDSPSKLTMALGHDIEGQSRVADLARMPHLLVAGATGAGKSVCLNCIILSFLYKSTPDEVRLLLVDPKRIELAVYANMPHLVHPVVTDMAQAKAALEWAVYEMDRRYEAMAVLGVRNIDGFNAKLDKLPPDSPERGDLSPLPYLVIVIDELADLMLTSGKEVEVLIVRLAQLARAAGIHMILATQRPSVDVVTGLIKANFPSRISFQVTSKHDSRTILDTVGAEFLLGRGDSLFKPGAGKIERVHGAFVSDDETAAVVEHWRSRRAPNFELDFSTFHSDSVTSEGGSDTLPPDDIASDPKYPEAVEFVMSQGKASISLIQRRLRIGFNRAARFIEQMEQDGVIGPADGSKPRLVLKGRE